MKMSDDWENDNFEPPEIIPEKIVDNRWEGEDEEDVKDSWDDPEKTHETTSSAAPKKKKRTLQQIIAEKEEKKRKEMEEKRKLMEAQQAVESPESILAEKLRRQKMQEEADLQIARECFGSVEGSLSSKESFDEFKKLIMTRLGACENSPNYVSFLDELLRELCVNLDPDDIKRLSSTLTALCNEKIKMQKAAKGKKKTQKPKVNLGKNDIGAELQEDFGEYEDFM